MAQPLETPRVAETGGGVVTLSPLSAADVETASLRGELGCSFAGEDGAARLIAMGDVASTRASEGVLKVAGAATRVTAPGGFDAMLKGGVFSGAGHTARIDLTGPASGGGESPPRPATLTLAAASGERLVLPGQWTCGP